MVTGIPSSGMQQKMSGFLTPVTLMVIMTMTIIITVMTLWASTLGIHRAERDTVLIRDRGDPGGGVITGIKLRELRRR